MRIINILLIFCLLVSFFSCSQYQDAYYKGGNAPVSVYGDGNFGNVKINESGISHKFIVETEENDEQTSMSNGYVQFSYKPVKIRIGISDTLNFTLDTSGTKSKLTEGDSTGFYVTFNPRSAGSLTAVLTVNIYDEDGDFKETQTFNLSGYGI